MRTAAALAVVLAAGYAALQWMKPRVDTMAIRTDNVTVQDTLPDGSTAFLNRQSTITYQYNSHHKTRIVKLQGEGFFEVKHEEEKPFMIETDEVLIRDIGTAFNVKAYPDQDTVEVFVESGIVQLFTMKDPGIQLTAGETGLYSRRGKVFSKAPVVDTNVLAYKTKMLSFNATELESAITTINAVYASRIKLGNHQLGTCRLTVNFINEDLNHLVDIVAETLGLTVERKDSEIILNGTCQ
jgi:ferric-dicitrate binding protein FerR (iron transport regulator)